MQPYPKSREILEHNRLFIAGGVASVNRTTQPEIVFVRGKGQYLWDADGRIYLDYHAAFAAQFLGHNDPYVSEAVQRVLSEEASLYGSGTTVLEGRLAELLCAHIPFVKSVQFVNTGSEATYQAIRVARAATGRDHVIVTQGGYNGWHNDVCCNLMTPLDRLGPRVCPGEYSFVPISAGIPEDHKKLIHIVNFNDLESVEYVCEKYPVATLITEPILQNVGVILPRPGYLQGLRKLADKYGFVLILDEVKTGFRHALGGYASLANVEPDLVTYGKALANGYPIAAIGGNGDLMDYFVHPDPGKRVLLAGTHNAHPVPTAAAIATIERLSMDNGEAYRHTECLAQKLEKGLQRIFAKLQLKAIVARQGSAFCVYFMDHAPADWHDLAANHDFRLDEEMRRHLIDRGIYAFPLAPKQWSISCAHTAQDIEMTLERFESCLTRLAEKAASHTSRGR